MVAPLENNGKLFATVNVGVHTSLLRAVYEPLLKNALRLMALALIVALAAAFLLSNLALRPIDPDQPATGPPDGCRRGASRGQRRIKNRTWRRWSRQRSRRSASACATWRRSTPRCGRISTRFSGNLQDGILLFTEDKRAVLVSEAARRFLHVDRDDILGRHAREIFTNTTAAGPDAARGRRSRRPHGEGRDSHRKRAAHPGLGGFYLRR